MSERRLFDKRDLILIALLLVVAVCFFIPKFFSSEALTADIICGGEKVKTIELDKVEEPYTVELNGGKVVIGVEKNCIYFIESDCKDGLCVNCGRLTGSGQTAVCIPQGVAVAVRKGDKNAPDVIAY